MIAGSALCRTAVTDLIVAQITGIQSVIAKNTVRFIRFLKVDTVVAQFVPLVLNLFLIVIGIAIVWITKRGEHVLK